MNSDTSLPWDDGVSRETPGRTEARSKELLAWSYHPAGENPAQAVLVALFVVLVPAAIFWMFGDLFLTGLAAVIFLVSLAHYFVPTKVRLTTEGIEMRRFWGRQFRPWSQFRRYECDRTHFRLCTLSRRSRLDQFRGLLARFPADREAVIHILQNQINTPEKR
ncbi:MAG: hypothetical protein HKN20_12540 [Gemmatimonadetes bacterium]|nr:hypothetical protein [Gemmatimonadota bacterium]